jgi:hypothetical protein
MNWKEVAKYFWKYYRSQFLLWVEMYNEVADVYMIDQSWSVGSENTTVYLKWSPFDCEAE